MPSINFFEYTATALFFCALVHIFIANKISNLALSFKDGSFAENFFHLFGEVEIVFGFWSAILVFISILMINFEFTINYLNGRNFTEALFVFVIMAVCSTKPILNFTEKLIVFFSKLVPLQKSIAVYFVILIIGPLLGSFITEPAAMTICAYLLLPLYFTKNHSLKFKYATIALLFVNISIGGTLTPIAAPPIIMVANKWGWDLHFMLKHFAIKTLLSVFLNTLIVTFIFRNELVNTVEIKNEKPLITVPFYISLIHLLFLLLIVGTSHYPVLFIGIFLFFIGFLRATREYQSPLQLREPLLVAFFLSGLIVLGGPQRWWLEPIIGSLTEFQLFLGAIGLTAFTDNAALTYLGSLIPHLNESSRLALVSGSVVGGGLTIIANAPNPAGFGILRKSFPQDSFSPAKLFFMAFPLTVVTALIYLIL